MGQWEAWLASKEEEAQVALLNQPWWAAEASKALD